MVLPWYEPKNGVKPFFELYFYKAYLFMDHDYEKHTTVSELLVNAL